MSSLSTEEWHERNESDLYSKHSVRIMGIYVI